jgi:pathogenesis-related protein 1
MIALWTNEAADYAYTTHRCRGPACGHYTQMVWRGSASVGCGAAMCPFGRYLVCNYAPPGNVVGRRPY